MAKSKEQPETTIPAPSTYADILAELALVREAALALETLLTEKMTPQDVARQHVSTLRDAIEQIHAKLADATDNASEYAPPADAIPVVDPAAP